MKKQILLPLAFVAFSLGSVACGGSSQQASADSIQQAQLDSIQAQRTADSLAQVAAADSIARAERTAAEIELITKLYNSKLVEMPQELSAKKELSQYCTESLLDELKALYKKNPELMDGDPTNGYATYAFTAGEGRGYDAPDYRPVQISVEPSGEHTYIVSYKHLGRKRQTELQLTSDGADIKIERIIKRAW